MRWTTMRRAARAIDYLAAGAWIGAAGIAAFREAEPSRWAFVIAAGFAALLLICLRRARDDLHAAEAREFHWRTALMSGTVRPR